MLADAQPDITEINTQMVFIKAGNFEMGNNNGKADAKPLHTVTLNDFYIGKYEATQELWHQSGDRTGGCGRRFGGRVSRGAGCV